MSMAPDTFLGLRFEPEIAKALAAYATKNGREPKEQVIWLVIEALDKAGLLPADLRAWLMLREQVVGRFGLKAVAIIRSEGWRNDIIAETARRLMAEDRAWAADYETLIGCAPYTKKVKLKERINPLLGRRVKLLLRAETGKAFSVGKEAIFTTASYLLPPKGDAV
jgi:hypothetical protein